MRHLMRIASELGVRVHVAHIDDDPTLLGYYNDEAQAIVLRMDLTPSEMRCVLAHELAHAYYRDRCSPPGSAVELRAERRAAEYLIDPIEYALAEALNSHPAAIAEELNVTQDVIESYQRLCLQRLGRRTYGVSRRQGLHGELARQLSG